MRRTFLSPGSLIFQAVQRSVKFVAFSSNLSQAGRFRKIPEEGLRSSGANASRFGALGGTTVVAPFPKSSSQFFSEQSRPCFA
jgi:hypothetical protein